MNESFLGQNVELLLLVVTFLKKLSVFLENKNEVRLVIVDNGGQGKYEREKIMKRRNSYIYIYIIRLAIGKIDRKPLYCMER